MGESDENLVNMQELVNLIRGSDLPFICVEDWNMTPEEKEKTRYDGLHWRGDKDA